VSRAQEVTTWFVPLRGLAQGAYFVRLTPGYEMAGVKVIVLE
jgi:hypothetical protein